MGLVCFEMEFLEGGGGCDIWGGLGGSGLALVDFLVLGWLGGKGGGSLDGVVGSSSVIIYYRS